MGRILVHLHNAYNQIRPTLAGAYGELVWGLTQDRSGSTGASHGIGLPVHTDSMKVRSWVTINNVMSECFSCVSNHVIAPCRRAQSANGDFPLG